MINYKPVLISSLECDVREIAEGNSRTYSKLVIDKYLT